MRLRYFHSCEGVVNSVPIVMFVPRGPIGEEGGRAPARVPDRTLSQKPEYSESSKESDQSSHALTVSQTMRNLVALTRYRLPTM
jgi:hypothetical protein